ncbi:hypothetical protein [Streptomyces sp. NPDC051109]|uniref:hypothetical protein n=1 Tax=Streptomyces sp. NPDC051109 TaxID=3365642 RepID=UPI0010ED6613
MLRTAPAWVRQRSAMIGGKIQGAQRVLFKGIAYGAGTALGGYLMSEVIGCWK